MLTAILAVDLLFIDKPIGALLLIQLRKHHRSLMIHKCSSPYFYCQSFQGILDFLEQVV